MKYFINNTLGIQQRVWLVGIPATVIYILFAIGFFLKRKIEPLGKIPLFIGRVVYFVPFTMLNILFNLTCGSFIFLEMPRELPFTSRLSRHKLSSNKENRDVAMLLCSQLNKHDPNHC